MREVLLRVALRNYERARDVMANVTERTQRTLATAKDVTAELRAGLDAARQLGQEREDGGLASRGAAASRRDIQAGERQRFGRLFGPINDVRERAESLGRFADMVGGDAEASQVLPALLTGAARLVPGIGPFLAVLAPITQGILKHMEEKLQREIDKREARLLARLDAEARDRDYNRRIAEDPRFAREQARLALQQTLVEEARLGKRVERTRADLIADYGL